MRGAEGAQRQQAPAQRIGHFVHRIECGHRAFAHKNCVAGAIGPVDRLVQVVLNLALNAADAIRGDGRSKGQIAISARVDEGKVIIEVVDDGPGIPAPLRERVFEPFFTTKPAGEGTGLGLPTSAAIVEQAGGSIAVLNREDGGDGARMVVTIPAGRLTLTSGSYEKV